MLGAAEIIKNDELKAEVLHMEIEKMLGSGRLDIMGKNASKISIENAQNKIYDEILNLINMYEKL